ncbi:uncharacterized protein LOC120354265 [Nilaparvata lugens]|uniref:uncharacterized protein LOC120354265 n=1 Tax=Nilaparvata lugens TaxID=108931 RepID=UPI00193D2464|nr:uncharacterized protein LOC120354265 [Nilaparvata lugens]
MLSGPQVVVQPASRPGSRMNYAAGGQADALALQQQGGPSSETSETNNMAAMGEEERGVKALDNRHADSDDDLDDEEARPRTVLGGGGGAPGGGYWGSRPPSPGGGADNLSESSSNMPPHAHHHHHHHNRRKSMTGPPMMTTAAAAGPMADPNGHKFNNLNYWKARKVKMSAFYGRSLDRFCSRNLFQSQLSLSNQMDTSSIIFTTGRQRTPDLVQSSEAGVEPQEAVTGAADRPAPGAAQTT